MWLVRLALSRPKTVAVMAVMIFLFGGLSILQMPKDIFPAIDLPVVSVIWSYGGLSPHEMDRRIVRLCESSLLSNVNNIEHVESQALPGAGIIKVYFQPGTEISSAITQISATTQAAIRSMPQGITPPSILQYDASDVPIIQIAMSSDTAPISQIADDASTIVLPQLVTVNGASIAPPVGGMGRVINVDLDPQEMIAQGVTAQDVTSAIGSQNLILPTGDVKMGSRDYLVHLNNSPTVVDGFNDLPIKVVDGATVNVSDVAHVRNGNSIPTTIVRVDGHPAVLLTLLKNGDASTIDVVDRLKAKIPEVQAMLPKDIKLDLLLDQSVFVRGAVDGVVREAVIASCLTGLMILLFLGSWRSTLVVAISIPLSILTSIVVLRYLGQTLNTLTLGGLSLAVGMLVDDATVEVENTTRNLGNGLPLTRAILHSAQQVALPALTSTLSICIVFVPVALLAGVAQSLFMPLATAVVFAMLPSYFFSRTLVTTMMQHLLGQELDLYRPEDKEAEEHRESEENHENRVCKRQPDHKKNFLWRIHVAFDQRFEKVRSRYRNGLDWVLHHRAISVGVLLVFFAISAAMMPFLGQDFFPLVDAGQMRLHVRVPPGTRLDETGKIFSEIEESIRKVLPPQEITLILDNIGLGSGANYVRNNTGTIGNADGEIDISLSPKHDSIWNSMSKLRHALQKQYPNCIFYFVPADISTQVLDFGTSAPIDIQVREPFPNDAKDYAIAQRIEQQATRVSGVVDSFIYQVQNDPELNLVVDRTRAAQVGATQQNVAGNVLVSLSSSSLVSPSYFLDESNGVQYTVSVQTPQYKVDSVDSILDTPVTSVNPATGQTTPVLLSNLATVGRDTTPAVVSEYQDLPVYDVFASVQNRDLGGAVSDIQRLLSEARKQAPRGTIISLAGQATTMQTSFHQMGFGLILAIILIYLLLTINFESWVDPLVILMAAPGALSGVLWGLFLTQTTFNVPSLMGGIMSIGVATANGILLVTFANEQRNEGKDAVAAAMEAGYTRFRPVLMTALAMILGMLPMSLGLGDGGEENAPLGRAVVGGLAVATLTTLFFVPLMYTVLRRKQPAITGPEPENEDRPGDAETDRESGLHRMPLKAVHLNGDDAFHPGPWPFGDRYSPNDGSTDKYSVDGQIFDRFLGNGHSVEDLLKDEGADDEDNKSLAHSKA